MIPMVNLKAHHAAIKDEFEQGLSDILKNCTFILGSNVQDFEQEVASYLGVKHAIGVASGTDALHLALLALGIGKGDEVITSAFTFIATAEAIRYVGAKPVFVDIAPDTFNITAEAIQQAITDKTVAVMPVHLFGQPANILAIKDICASYQLKLIEDCAQSFGASVNGKQTGSWGDVAGYSFFPSKNLGAYGDGGLVVTQSDNIATMLKKLRNHGSDLRYHHDVIGYNSRLDEIQALVLRIKLKRIDEYNRRRRRASHLYSKLLKDLPLHKPLEDGVGLHVYHQYTLLSKNRNNIIQALRKQQIGSAIYYPVPLHQQQVFAAECHKLNLPITEKIATQCLSLPICPFLTETQIHSIATEIIKLFK